MNALSKYLIIACSLSGCTEKMAEIISDHLVSKGFETKSIIADDVTREDLNEYQHILIGTWTYTMSSVNEILLPYEIEDLMDTIEDSDVSTKRFGVFGSCDSSYKFYGGSIELLANTLKGFGASVMDDHLEIELYPDTDEQISTCVQFAERFREYVRK